MMMMMMMMMMMIVVVEEEEDSHRDPHRDDPYDPYDPDGRNDCNDCDGSVCGSTFGQKMEVHKVHGRIKERMNIAMKKLRRWLSSTPSYAKVVRFNVLTEETGNHQSHLLRLPAVACH